ncbi:Uncharacterized protein HZ326_8220 [Fusarium oxysporum f. sp. albedinis]|nr:Uncharacterized protein HZ326_8220 [Fusarium oxysporum f. sp. albedinis]
MSRSTETSSKSSASCRISRKKNSNRDSKKSKRDATLALSLDHARDFLSSICIVAYRTSRFAFRYPNKGGSHKLPLEVKAHSVEARILKSKRDSLRGYSCPSHCTFPLTWRTVFLRWHLLHFAPSSGNTYSR